jgi:tryptophan synthase alpha chain
VTGARTTLPENLAPTMASLRQQTSLPIAVGFGISSAEQAAAVGELADMVVVGSAIMRLVEEHAPANRAVEEVAAFVRSLKTAMVNGQKKSA